MKPPFKFESMKPTTISIYYGVILESNCNMWPVGAKFKNWDLNGLYNIKNVTNEELVQILLGIPN